MDPSLEVRARIPADVEAPDRIVFNLTARQAAILVVAAAAGYLTVRVLGPLVPVPVLVLVLTPFAGAAVTVALGRRDGVPLDVWLWAAVRYGRSPRLMVAAPVRAVPDWAPHTDPPAGPVPGLLRLPVDAIAAGGAVDVEGRAVALVAATTVNVGLRTGAEQAALVAGYGRWLNGLTGPVQVVVSTRRVELSAAADRLVDAAAGLPHPALADAAVEHAEFLLDVAEQRDPLWRTVTVACTAPGGPGGAVEALRRAEHTAAALAALGGRTRVLDGPAVAAVLATAVDPFAPVDASWPRALPQQPVTGPAVGLAVGPAVGSAVGSAVGPATVPAAVARPAPVQRVRRGTGGADGTDRAGGAGGAGGGAVRRVRSLLAAVARRPVAPPPVADPAATAGVAEVVGPAAVQHTPDHLRVGDGYVATLIVTGYPPEVGMSWLEPILAWPGRLDVVQHIEPVPAVTAAARLRRQRARLESNRRFDADRGGLGDPAVDAAAEDAADLADRVARGAARLFRVGHLLCVHAGSVPELTDAVAEVRAAAASVLLDTQPATWRQLQAWTSSLPLAVDSIGMRRIVDSDALAAAFPFGSYDLPAPLPGEGAPAGGVLYGLSTGSNGVVWWDRWQQDNHNSVVLARSGAGKSYLVKLETLRSLYDGVHVAIIDPEGEYLRLCDAVGGVAVELGVAGVRVNPFEVPAADRRPDALQRRAMFIHTLVGVLLGEQPPAAERAALDRAVLAAYRAAGITGDPGTWHRPPPVLRDLAAALTAGGDPAGHALAVRLSPWVDGSFKDLFDGRSTVQAAGPLVVWSVRQLPDELRAVGMLLALDAIWRAVDGPTAGAGGGVDVRRLVVVDEAWTLLREGEGARFLYRLSKAARKRRAGVAVVTQDAADLLGSDLGAAVVANAGTQVLMRQAPQAIERVTERFALTAGEARMLLSAGRGEALLLAGAHRVAFQAVASAREHALCCGVADEPAADLEDNDRGDGDFW